MCAYVHACLYVCMCPRAHVCACAHVRMRAHACVSVRVRVHARGGGGGVALSGVTGVDTKIKITHQVGSEYRTLERFVKKTLVILIAE